MTVAMLKYIFDESGDSRKHDFYAMAGVVATLRQWKSFYKNWRVALKAGRPIRYFKMSEAAGRRGEFDPTKGWTVALVKEKVKALTDVLASTVDSHIVVLVPMLTFREVMRTTSFGKEYENPYLYCFMESLDSVAFKMDGLCGKQRKPLLIFDDQNKFLKKTCSDIFHSFRDEVGPDQPQLYKIGKWLGNIDFQEDKEQEIGIQAADLVAWHYRTIPWEMHFKKHRRRPFVSQIKNLPLISLRPDLKRIEQWRAALQNCVKLHKAESER